MDFKIASKSNEPVNDTRRRVVMWRKGGYVGCATDASVGGTRISFKLRRGCCELTLRTNLLAGPAANYANILPWGAAVVLDARAGLATGRAIRRERCLPVRHESAAPSCYALCARRLALRRPTATRMPKMMASGRGGQPGM